MNPHIERYMKLVLPSVVAPTQRIYRLTLTQFDTYLGDTDLTTVDTPYISTWLRSLIETHKASTTIGHKHIIKRMFTWLQEEKIIDNDPFFSRHLPKFRAGTPDKRIFTIEEYSRILAVSLANHRTYWYPSCVIAYWTGLRLGDVSQLEWTEINFEEEIIRLVPQKTKRFEKVVEIPMEIEVIETLRHSRDTSRYPNNRYVSADMAAFYQGSGGSHLSSQFGVLCRRAGLPNHSFHCFRHTMVSRLLNGGVDSLIISKITGMAVDEIMTYAHISLDAKRDAMFKARSNLSRGKENSHLQPPKE